MLSQKISVLHLYKDYYPPIVGGIEKNINLICTSLKNEFDIKVLVSNRKCYYEKEVIDGIEIYKIGSLFRIASAPISPTYPFWLKKFKADILHFHHPNPTSELSYLLAKPKGKVVVTYHSDIIRQKLGLKLYSGLLKRFLANAKIILATSSNYIESSEFLSKFKHKCRVVPLGIDLEKFSIRPEEKELYENEKRERNRIQVVFVGMLRYYKGLHFLIDAMREVDAELKIIGKGPEEDSLRKQVGELGLNEKIKFLGEISDKELVKELYLSDIFCLPSHLRSEAYGVCQIEAMTCGLPVVSTNLNTGVPFVNKDGESGIIVEVGSSKALANAINFLIKNPEKRMEMGKKAQRRAKALFSSKTMVDEIKKVYYMIINQN